MFVPIKTKFEALKRLDSPETLKLAAEYSVGEGTVENCCRNINNLN